MHVRPHIPHWGRDSLLWASGRENRSGVTDGLARGARPGSYDRTCVREDSATVGGWLSGRVSVWLGGMD